MNDAHWFVLIALMGLVCGRILAFFLRWISRQKSDMHSQRAVSESWRAIGTWGALTNIIMAWLNAAEGHLGMMKSSLVAVVLFASIYCGAWLTTRYWQSRG